MTHITLVRHGQANSTARDEQSYDKLSELGHQQAAWLGDYFRNAGERFARSYRGTLRRHQETLAGIAAEPEPVLDPRLNEMEYFTLAGKYEAQHNVPVPTHREGFAAHLPKVLGAWQAGEIEQPPESFEAFQTRTQAALADIAKGEGPALVVTSGGLIGMVMRILLDLEVSKMAQLCLMVQNSSLHRVQEFGGTLVLGGFNQVPHLDTPERRFAQTHI